MTEGILRWLRGPTLDLEILILANETRAIEIEFGLLAMVAEARRLVESIPVKSWEVGT